MNLKGNTLVIADTHFPAEHRKYLQHCLDTKKQYNCKNIVHVGDVADFHNISYHEHDPDYVSISDELKQVRKCTAIWSKAFPNVHVCIGNHDALVYRKAMTHGFGVNFVKSLNEILALPKEWKWNHEWIINGVLFKHGTGGGGSKYPHALAINHNRQSTVVGHFHSCAGIHYSASPRDLLWGMCVGCGVDRNHITQKYGANYSSKPILTCGVVSEEGFPTIIPMKV